MEELRTHQQISWLDEVDAQGVIINPSHELYGRSIAGNALYFPSASGSTVGSDRIVNLAVNGFAPKKIVLEKVDPITMWGAILGKIDIEVSGTVKKPVDRSALEKLGIDAEIVDFLVRAGASSAPTSSYRWSTSKSRACPTRRSPKRAWSCEDTSQASTGSGQRM